MGKGANGKGKGKRVKDEMGKNENKEYRDCPLVFLLSLSPFIRSYNGNPYNFAALSQVILRLSSSGTPTKVFSTNSRECGNVDAWCG